MARYEDTATPFAEAQFAGVRERKQQEARKQEKFAKKLLLVQTAAKGANAIINSRAKEFDANQIGQKTSYNKFISDGQKLIKTQDQITATGKSKQQYFHDFFYKQLVAEGKGQIPEYFKGADYQSHLYQKAEKLAADYTVNFDKALKSAQAAPSLAEYTAKYDIYAKDVQPRSIFSTATNFIKGIGKKETPETLAFKNERAKNAIHGTPMAQKLNELGLNLDILEAAGYDSMEILSDANAIARKKGKMIENQSFEKFDEDDGKGGTLHGIRMTGTHKGTGNPIAPITVGSVKRVRNDDDYVDHSARIALINAMPTSMQADFVERMGPDLLKADLIDFEVEIVQNKITDIKNLVDAKAEVRKQYDLTRNQRYKLITQEMIDKPINNLTEEDLGKEMWTRPPLDKDLIQDNPAYAHVIINEGLDYDSYEKDMFKRMRVRYDDFAVSEGSEEEDEQGTIDFTETNMRRLEYSSPVLVNVDPKDKEKVQANINEATSTDAAVSKNILGLLIKNALENKGSPLHIDKQYNGQYNGGVFAIANKANLRQYFGNGVPKIGSILYDPDTKEFFITDNETPADPNPVVVKAKGTASLADTQLNDLVSNAFTKMSGKTASSIPVLYIPGLQDIVDNVTTDTLVQKGYLTKASSRSNWRIRQAKTKYRQDIRAAVNEKIKTEKISLASL